ncbi:unnamed protein product [Phytophthora fragariaefolia]|uniref:Unnamed protein product n=1 Tax=Phytophthora fragariaefolia TaxID=1490495 RepID=A0A9W6XST5_9STRA|nr:unnamed protein product [Phytophthora fragariaefolia]
MAVSTSGSLPADTTPAGSPTTAPPLALSAAETAGPNAPPSSGQPGGQALTSLTPPRASRAGAESASARSPTPATAESSTEPEDSVVGSTSPPLSSASSASSPPTSVGLGLLSGAGGLLSSPPELQTSGPPMVSLPCSVNLRAPLVEVAAGPRFPDAPPFESAEELDEFFQQASPKSSPTASSTSSGEGLSTPPRTPRSNFRRRLDEKPFPIVESPPKPSLDDPAMHLVSPASPIGSPTESPRASVPPGFRQDGLLGAGVPPLPKPSPVQAKPAASSPVRRSPPSTSLSAPSSASPAGSRPNSITELWDFLEAEREAEDRTRTQLTAYALMRPALPTDFALRRDLLRARSFGGMLDVLRANTAEPPSSIKELAELRVQNAKLTRDNQALLRRLESALADSTRVEHDLATVVRERDEWKRHATKTSELVASFRNTVCVLELQLRESTRQANRRVDSCSNWSTIYVGWSTSATRISSACRRSWPSGTSLRGPVTLSSTPVSLPLSSAAPTSNSSAAGLAMTSADFHAPSAEPRRVPGSPFRRDHLTPVTRPSVHVSASSSVPRSGSAASAALVTSSTGLVSSMVVTSAPESTASSRCFCCLGEFCPAVDSADSPQATKASAESISKSARKSPTKDAAGSSRRAPCNSAASPSSTSTVAPAPSVTGSARSQRASALNARAINSLELQALEASDAEVLGWSSGAVNSAARATSASSPLVVDSTSPRVVTPTPAPVGTSSSQGQSSSDDSADDEVAL